jgi:large subunit ribosomal protein L20
MRVKSIASKRHRKILKLAKGYKNARHKRIKTAIEAVLHAGQYAYVGRKNRKRDMRGLWILRISAAAQESGLNYNKFISGLKKQNIALDRKVLADIAVTDPETFKTIASEIK